MIELIKIFWFCVGSVLATYLLSIVVDVYMKQECSSDHIDKLILSVGFLALIICYEVLC